MVETFATSQYKEKFFGNLTLAQSGLLLAAAAPGIYMAVRGYPTPLLIGWGLLCLILYAGVSYFELDEKVRVWLGYASSKKRFIWRSRAMEEFIGIDDIDNDSVQTKDGRLLAVVKVFPKDLGGLSGQDIERLLAGYGSFLHELSTNIQIIMSSTEINVEGYLQRLKEKVYLSGVPQRLAYFEHFSQFMRGVVESKTVTDRDYYIVITQPKSESLGKSLGDLEAKAKNLMSSLRDAGIECERLGTERLIGFYGSFYNPKFRYDGESWCPVSFHDNIEGLVDAQEWLGRFAQGIDPSSPLYPERAVRGFERGGYDYVKESSDRRRHILKQLMPSSIDIRKDHAEVEKLHRVLFAVRFPAVVHPGWLTRLIRQPIDFDIVFHIHPLSQKTSIDYLQHEITKLETDVTAKERDGLLVAEKDRVNLQKVKELLGRVSRDQEKCFDVALYVNVKAYNGKELDVAVLRIRDVLEGMNAHVRVANWEMGDALRSCYPLAEDRLGESRDRLFPSSAVRDSYPFILSSLEDRGENAIVVGYNQLNGIPVLLDVFSQPNPHVLVLGSSGSGKSFLVKKMFLSMAMQDADIFIIDPQGEYREVVKRMGGQAIALAHESKSVINLFDIGHDTYDGRKGAVKAFFNIVRGNMDGQLSGAAVGIVDKMTDISYRKAGIFPDDPSTWGNPAPTFSDVYQALNQFAGESTSRADAWKKTTAEALLTYITPFVDGDMRYLNQRTTVDLRGKNIVCFDISSSSAYKPTERALLLFIVFDHIYSWMKRQGRTRRKMIIVDEAWSVFENNQDYLGPIVRCGRKENLSVVMLDQDVEDLLATDSEGRPRGHVILNNTSTKFLLRQEAAALGMVCDKFALTDGQRAFIQNAGAGDTLMLTPTLKLPIYVLASDEELRMLSTTPTQPQPPRNVRVFDFHFDPASDPVLPHGALSSAQITRVKAEGYVEVTSPGLSQNSRTLYYVKAPNGEDENHTIAKTLILKGIRAYCRSHRILGESVTLGSPGRLQPDLAFRLPGGGLAAIEILQVSDFTLDNFQAARRLDALRQVGCYKRCIFVAADVPSMKAAKADGYGEAIMPHQFMRLLEEVVTSCGGAEA